MKLQGQIKPPNLAIVCYLVYETRSQKYNVYRFLDN